MKSVLTILAAASLIVVAACSSSSPPSPMAPPAKTVVVQVQDNVYVPQQVDINSGDTVRWIFQGQIATHTVTALNGGFDSGFVFQQAGDVFERTFNERDVTFEYSCQSHKACCAMQGSVRVGDLAPPPLPGY